MSCARESESQFRPAKVGNLGLNSQLTPSADAMAIIASPCLSAALNDRWELLDFRSLNSP